MIASLLRYLYSQSLSFLHTKKRPNDWVVFENLLLEEESRSDEDRRKDKRYDRHKLDENIE